MYTFKDSFVDNEHTASQTPSYGEVQSTKDTSPRVLKGSLSLILDEIAAVIPDNAPENPVERQEIVVRLLSEITNICKQDLRCMDIVERDVDEVYDAVKAMYKGVAALPLIQQHRITSYIDSDMQVVPVGVTISVLGSAHKAIAKPNYIHAIDRQKYVRKMKRKLPKRPLGVSISLSRLNPEVTHTNDVMLSSEDGKSRYVIDGSTTETFTFDMPQSWDDEPSAKQVESLQKLMEVIKQSSHI